MKVAIVGAGVMGSIMGSFLVKGGADVWFVDPFKAHMDAITEKGLIMEDISGNRETIKVRAVTDASLVNDVMDVIIFLVKGLHTKSAAEGARCLTDKNTLIVTLQNGVGNVAILSEVFPKDNVLYGCMMVSGRMIEPGTVFVKYDERSYVRVGAVYNEFTDAMKELEAVFVKGGLNFSLVNDIDKEIWSKMITNCTGNSLCGITRLPVGRLLNDENTDAGLEISKKIEEEVVAVANAMGIHLETGHIRNVPTTNVHIPSMSQDMLGRKFTEIDFLNGAVVSMGKMHGVPTPYNEAVTLMVKVIEKNYQHQQW